MASLAELRKDYVADDFADLIEDGKGPKIPDALRPAVEAIVKARGIVRAKVNGNGTMPNRTKPYDNATEKTGEVRSNILVVKQMNDVIADARQIATPKRLLGECWYEGEIIIKFGPTGRGKTAVALQAAQAIASGEPIRGEGDLVLDMDVRGGCPVVYVDFELGPKQLEKRFSRQVDGLNTEHFKFSSNLYRVTVEPEYIQSDVELTEQLLYSIEKTMKREGAKVGFIDNLTWLHDETEKGRAALGIMKGLIGIKKRYGASFAVLAHTSTKRDDVPNRPIELRDLFGSSMFGIFADGAIAFNNSAQGDNIRYLKQCKPSRLGGEIVYGSENVLTGRLEKPDNFLRCEFLRTEPESNHLREDGETDRAERMAAVHSLHAEGKSQREIATELGMSVSTVNKYLRQPPVRAEPEGVHDCSRTNTNMEATDYNSVTLNDTKTTVRSRTHANTSNGREQGSKDIELQPCVRCKAPCWPDATGLCFICNPTIEEVAS